MGISNDPNTDYPDILIIQDKSIPINYNKYIGISFNNIDLDKHYSLPTQSRNARSYLTLTKYGHT